MYVGRTAEYVFRAVFSAECGLQRCKNGDFRCCAVRVFGVCLLYTSTRSSYRQLIEAGVRIYEYTPGFIHSKMFVADDEVGVVGTANMDYRSFYLHFECGVAFFRSSVIQSVKQDILKTMEISQEIHPNPDERVPLLRRLGRAILKAFAPLM